MGSASINVSVLTKIQRKRWRRLFTRLCALLRSRVDSSHCIRLLRTNELGKLLKLPHNPSLWMLYLESSILDSENAVLVLKRGVPHLYSSCQECGLHQVTERRHYGRNTMYCLRPLEKVSLTVPQDGAIKRDKTKQASQECESLGSTVLSSFWLDYDFATTRVWPLAVELRAYLFPDISEKVDVSRSEKSLLSVTVTIFCFWPNSSPFCIDLL